MLCQRRQWHPTPVLLPGKFHGQRSLIGYSPWGCKESDMTERLHFFFFEKDLLRIHIIIYGLPWWLNGKESSCNARDRGHTSSIPGSGRSPGGRHGNPLQDSCLENPMDRAAWWPTVLRVAKSWHIVPRHIEQSEQDSLFPPLHGT